MSFFLQELMPEARSTASGLYFGSNYIVTGLAAILFGILADDLGIRAAFGLLGTIPVLSLPFALLMPDPPLAASRPSNHG